MLQQSSLESLPWYSTTSWVDRGLCSQRTGDTERLQFGRGLGGASQQFGVPNVETLLFILLLQRSPKACDAELLLWKPPREWQEGTLEQWITNRQRISPLSINWVNLDSEAHELVFLANGLLLACMIIVPHSEESSIDGPWILANNGFLNWAPCIFMQDFIKFCMLRSSFWSNPTVCLARSKPHFDLTFQLFRCEKLFFGSCRIWHF